MVSEQSLEPWTTAKRLPVRIELEKANGHLRRNRRDDFELIDRRIVVSDPRENPCEVGDNYGSLFVRVFEYPVS